MDDDQCSCLRLEPPSDDDEPSSTRPYNPFTATREDTPRTVYNDISASSQSASHGGQESAW
eukprot:8172320-Karenia_brevis.AAC.1